MSQKKILIVGAGISGATAARLLAEAGHKVLVIDRRKHIAGNLFDQRTPDGTLIHQYGPHLWHTSNATVQRWVDRFTEWHIHNHWVEAILPNGRRTPLPVNYQTVEDVFEAELIARYGMNYRARIHIPHFLKSLTVHHENPTNGRELMESKIGKDLTELFFARYTQKMWDMSLDDLPASIVARVGARDNYHSAKLNGYFTDEWQYVPKDGYTSMIGNMLEHNNITVALGTDRRELAPFKEDGLVFGEFEDGFDTIFTCEPLDEMYDCDLGPLKWRSIKFHTQKVEIPRISKTPVTNFTHTGPLTRFTEWKNIPGHEGNDPNITWITYEEPCDYTENDMERYYPVKTAGEIDENRELWKKYRDRAEADGYILLGRLANYCYIDMHQAVASALAAAEKYLKGTTVENGNDF